MQTYILSVVVDNNPGVLTRVCQLFNRRSYNLESVTAGVTEDEKISRLTLITRTENDDELQQIIKQIRKLENVHDVYLIDKSKSICKEIMFVRVKTSRDTLEHIMNITNIFKSEIVDVAQNNLVIQISGDEPKLKAFQEMISPFGILALVSSGYIAIQRGGCIGDI